MQFFRITESALDLITKFEGFSNTVYLCPAIKPTIGFGHVIKYQDYFDIFNGEFLKHTTELLYKQSKKRHETNRLLSQIFPMLTTRQNAINLLKQDLKNPLAVLKNRITVPLTLNQVSSLLSFIYNVGIKAFEKSTLLRKLNDNDFDGAANEFDRWIYAGKKPLKGLIHRRKLEKELFLTC